jgi:hypothetical protein
MSKKKKKSKRRPGDTPKKAIRLVYAKKILPNYEGVKLVRAYRKKCHVDIPSAVRELREVGYEFKPGVAENLLRSEEGRIASIRRKKILLAEKKLAESRVDRNGDFYYIGGYTSGGCPYGVTWAEMGLNPWEDE